MRPRVLVGLCEISGYYGNLARGMRELGVDCVALNLGPDPFAYGVDSALPRWVRVCVRLYGYGRERRCVRLSLAPLLLLLRTVLAVWATCRFDVYILGYRSTFLWYAELPVLRLLHKKIIYCFHGSDARPPYLDGSLMATDRGLSVADCARLTRRSKRSLRRIERHADVIVCHAPFAQLLERPFISFLTIGIPMPVSSAPKRAAGGPVRVVHAPSHPEAKGTPVIREIVARLVSRGLPIDYIELTQRPNAEVRETLAGADVLLDQLYSDTPMPGLATEAAAVGCPTVIGGYEAEEIVQSTDATSRPPSVFCHPDDLERELERLLLDPAARLKVGVDARDFLLRTWQPSAVAARYLRLATGDIPEAWWCTPGSETLTHGALLSDETRRHLVRTIVEAYGPGALELEDKPALRARLLEECSYPAEPHPRIESDGPAASRS